jgi:hypothetical protein
MGMENSATGVRVGLGDSLGILCISVMVLSGFSGLLHWTGMG